MSRFGIFLFTVLFLFVLFPSASAYQTTVVVNSSSMNLAYKGMLTGEAIYGTRVLWSQLGTMTPFNASERNYISDNNGISSTRYVNSAGSSSKDEIEYVNFSIPNVPVINWVLITANFRSTGSGENSWVGLYNRTGANWTQFSGNSPNTLFATRTYNISSAYDLATYTTLDNNSYLNLSVAVWSSGASSGSIDVDYVSAQVDYADNPVIISNGTTRMEIWKHNFTWDLYRNNISITSNDANDTQSYFRTLSSGTNYLSSTYSATVISQNDSYAKLSWNTAIENGTVSFSIPDENNVSISRNLTSYGANILNAAEMVMPMLSNSSGFDYLMLNSTLSANSLGWRYPFSNGGLYTRYAVYDYPVVVSDIDQRYFTINMSGTSELTKSVRQDLKQNLTVSSDGTYGNINDTLFYFGMIHNNSYPSFDVNYSMSNGQTAWQNFTFTFNTASTSLPEDNPWVNETAINSIENLTVRTDARKVIDNVIGETFLGNYYPNGSTPYMYEGGAGYYSYTTLTTMNAINGLYYFSGNNTKRAFREEWDGFWNLNTNFSQKSSTLLQSENYSQCSGWTLGYYSSYSGGATMYTSSVSTPCQFNFSGDTITLHYTQYGGKMNISVDDGANITLDTYGDGSIVYDKQYAIPVSAMSYNPGENPTSGTHNVKFYWTNTKNASAPSTQVDVDALQVTRSDQEYQGFGYMYYYANGTPYIGDLFTEQINVTINGTIYPINVSLFSTVVQSQGAVSYLPYSSIMAAYSIWKTDKNDTWIQDRISNMDRHLRWNDQMFYNQTTQMIQIPLWIGAHSYLDGAYTTGYDYADNELYILSADIMGQFYTALGDSTNATFWISRRDNVLNAVKKDFTQGGLWYNESVSGHYIHTREPGWIRIEFEEPNYGFTNLSGYIRYNSVSKEYSGIRDRQYSQSFADNTVNYTEYYTNTVGVSPVTFNFTGTGLRFISAKGSTLGKFNVSIDGVNTTVNQTDATTTNQFTFLINSSLNLSKHNVSIYYLNNPAGSYITLDAIEIQNMSIIALQSYALEAMSVNLFPSWQQNATVNWIYNHDPGLKTDYMYPPLPLTEAASGTIDSSKCFIRQTWGFQCWDAENSGHFIPSAAHVALISKNYSDASAVAQYMTGRNGLLEYFNENGTGLQGAKLNLQMSGGYSTVFVPFWGASYEASTDILPPASITNLTNTTGNFFITWNWTNPPDIDFNHVEIYENGTFIQNTTGTTYSNNSVAPHGTKMISTHTVDTTGNVNATWINNTATLANNAPIVITGGDKSANTSEWLNFTITSQDVDIDNGGNDIITYGTNASKGTFNTSSGFFSWNIQEGETGLYYWYFNVSDNYGGTGNDTITVNISDLNPPASITNNQTTSGNFYINNTWTNPITPDFNYVMFKNISGEVLGNMSNTTWNRTLSPHYTQNISSQTIDVTGNVNQTLMWFNATIPNNIPILSNTTNQTVNEGATVFLDIDGSDLDSDILNFSNNRTDLFTDWNITNGKGNWTTNYSSSGIYYLDIGVVDGYGGQSNYTMKITVNDVINVSSPPNITAYWNAINGWNQTAMSVNAANSVEFGINVNQTVMNVSWKKDGAEQQNTSSLNFTYNFNALGTFNITAQAFNTNGSSQIIYTVVSVVSSGGGGINKDWAYGWVNWSNGTMVNGATVNTSEGNAYTDAFGYYSFGYNFVHGNTYWFNISKSGIWDNKSVTFSSGDYEIVNGTLIVVGGGGNAPNITSWSNNQTTNDTLVLWIEKFVTVGFNVTANQTLTGCTWTGATQINCTTDSHAYKNFTSAGTQTVSITGSNVNGSTQTITWTVHVNGTSGLNLSGYVTNTLAAPLQNARLDFNGAFKFTDATGYYLFDNISEGTYTTLARAIGYTNQSNTTLISTNTIMNFTMQESTISGVLKNSMVEGLAGGLLGAVLIFVLIKKRKSK